MGFRRGVGLSAGLALALLILPAASAFGDVSSGQLHAVVAPDPWHLTITDGSGHAVLSENRGLGTGPTGTLGFSTATGWFHATRVISGGMQGGAYFAQLETTDPTRGIQVRLEPDLRDRVPEHLPRNCGAGRIGWQRPRVTRSRVYAPQAVDALLPHTWCLRLTRHKAVGRRGAVGSKSVINIRGFRLLICETQITTHRPRFAISLASLFSSQLCTDVPHWTEISFSDIWRKHLESSCVYC